MESIASPLRSEIFKDGPIREKSVPVLSEDHRPKDWDSVIGQDKVTKFLETLEAKGKLNGRAYWITGPSGLGKTTIARILAAKIGDQWTIEEIDAGSCSKEVIEGIRNKGQYAPMTGCASNVLIINEAHGLNKIAIRGLLVALEQLTKHMTVIFTTTNDGMGIFEESQIDSKPLIDRCLPVKLAQRDICKVAATHLKGIAESEGLGGAALPKYERFLKDNGNSFRACFQAIESGLFLAQ